LAYVIGGAAGVAVLVLRSIRKAAAKRRFPIQLTIADFLCLFFMMQAVMASLVKQTLQIGQQGDVRYSPYVAAGSGAICLGLQPPVRGRHVFRYEIV
jgi:hypothetical protein